MLQTESNSYKKLILGKKKLQPPVTKCEGKSGRAGARKKEWIARSLEKPEPLTATIDLLCDTF